MTEEDLMWNIFIHCVDCWVIDMQHNKLDAAEASMQYALAAYFIYLADKDNLL